MRQEEHRTVPAFDVASPVVPLAGACCGCRSL